MVSPNAKTKSSKEPVMTKEEFEGKNIVRYWEKFRKLEICWVRFRKRFSLQDDSVLSLFIIRYSIKKLTNIPTSFLWNRYLTYIFIASQYLWKAGEEKWKSSEKAKASPVSENDVRVEAWGRFQDLLICSRISHRCTIVTIAWHV